jgi:hypothetical protein
LKIEVTTSSPFQRIVLGPPTAIVTTLAIPRAI